LLPLGIAMNMTATDSPVYFDPYQVEITRDPYPVYRRMRDEAPLYYNEEHDFFALSRYEDVRPGHADHETFSSARGGILEIIKQNPQLPPGMFIFEDPPLHTAHRSIVARLFSPRRMRDLEPMIRHFTVSTLDKLVGRQQFDIIADIGAEIPMRVIGALLGIPEEDQQTVRQNADDRLRTEAGKPIDYSVTSIGEMGGFEEYIDWRVKNPSDDVMTEFLNVEFVDDTGSKRKLTREEILTFCNVLAGAGNETTNRLIGWSSKVLAEHPEQRRQLVENPALIPDAIEEILRFEPPGPFTARYVTKDVEYYGQKVPAGSTMMFMLASANRDERRFPEPDRFDIHRDRAPHMSFGYGIHTCPGNVLARLEGRIFLEEMLKRFPEWNVDMENAELSCTSTVRGWETLPAYIGDKPLPATAPKAVPAGAAEITPASVAGTWAMVVEGPTGPQPNTLEIRHDNGQLSGVQTGDGVATPVEEIKLANGEISWTNKISKPLKMTLTFSGTVEGDSMTGKVKAGFIGKFPFSGKKTQ
jgi:cytochrome P450